MSIGELARGTGVMSAVDPKPEISQLTHTLPFDDNFFRSKGRWFYDALVGEAGN